MVTINGQSKVFFGTRKSDNAKIYLTKPSFDCGWYWGFGYLGNSREHYHLSGYQNGRNINMYDALSTDYNLAPGIKANLWLFCELVLSAYTLKESAEFYHRGGSHMTQNPLSTLLKNPQEEARINEELLPAIFNEIAKITG